MACQLQTNFVICWIPGGRKSNDIHSGYLLVKINFMPMHKCKNNHWIWHHNTRTSRFCDVTGQLWWCHNVKSEKTVLVDMAKLAIVDFFSGFVFRAWNSMREIKWCRVAVSNNFLSLVRRLCNDFHSWFCHSRKSLPKRITHEKYLIHDNIYINFYFFKQNFIQICSYGSKLTIYHNGSHKVLVPISWLNITLIKGQWWSVLLMHRFITINLKRIVEVEKNITNLNPNIVFPNKSHVQNRIPWNTIICAQSATEFIVCYKVWQCMDKNTVGSFRTEYH